MCFTHRILNLTQLQNRIKNNVQDMKTREGRVVDFCSSFQ